MLFLSIFLKKIIEDKNFFAMILSQNIIYNSKFKEIYA